LHYPKEISCKYCKKKFVRTNIAKKYCSEKCKLLANIKKTKKGCWNWTASLGPGRYGKIRYLGKTFRAHRASYILFNGEIPRGKLVCHSCDNPLCINPDHLFIGSQKENIRDMDSKNRRADLKGENHPCNKLKITDILEIKKLLSLNISQKIIAKKFNCHQSNISNIKRKKLWGHV